MMRFFTQIHPKIPSKSTNVMKNTDCLTVLKGNFVPCEIPLRKYSEKWDKQHPSKGTTSAREEKERIQMPGFVHPETMNEEGYFTQKARHQIEEHKKKKDKPTLRDNPDGRE